MSKFERYDRVVSGYDLSRIALGAEVIADCLAGGATPLAELSLLDAGCGTGNYSTALAGRVGRIDAVDLSPEMLAVARAKLAKAERAGRIAFHRAYHFANPTTDTAIQNHGLHSNLAVVTLYRL